MSYRLVICIVAIGFVRAAAAEEIDTAYLRGSLGYDAHASAYQVQQIAPTAYPTRAMVPPYRANETVPPPVYIPIRGAEPEAVPVYKGPLVVAPPVWFWTGFYIGSHFGGILGTANFADPFGPSIYGDDVTTPGFAAGAQIGYNWQAPNSPLVLGVEADFSWIDASGTNTCLAYSGLFVSADCRLQPDRMGDLTARVGWVYGPAGHSLVYAKGGAAVVHSQADITTNATADFSGLPPQVATSSFTKVGWTVGAGVEHAVAPGWSVKLEYDYINLGGETVATPQGLTQPTPDVNFYDFTSTGTTRVTESVHQVNLGLNYKLGADPSAQWHQMVAAFPVQPSRILALSGWEAEIGTRYWYSDGRFQKNLGDTADPETADMLASRLTYDSIVNSGEIFGRLESSDNIFLKGNVGLGGLSNGHLNDEDWVLFGGTVAYSNTLSDPVRTNISYATVDVGYDFFRSPAYKLGAFVGYNYYKDNKSAYGCAQIANTFSDCVPAVPNSVPVITEDDTWQSFRVGANGEMTVADRLKLGADIAYLPYAQFSGIDDHLLRALTIQESGVGRGMQLESILSYLITERFSVGVGGRYWVMWTTNNAIADFAGAPCPCQTQPAETQRYGVFVQAAYKLGSPIYR